MKKRITALAVLTVVISLIAAACGKADDGKITTTTVKSTSTTEKATTDNRTATEKNDSLLSKPGEKLSEEISEGITELKSDVSRMLS